MMGVFTDKVAGSITGAVRGRFEEAVRDTAFDLAKGCAAAPPACAKHVKTRMAAARADPRVQTAQTLIAAAVRRWPAV
uniref:Uncharacterized protein n=1 Tax=Phenylobacterium glaciei TaxID=2803784 RepID=A0A974P5D1_9CAUL|nr:hypothetical protein JKL49_11210 [Phenylobacterium glaciei]